MNHKAIDKQNDEIKRPFRLWRIWTSREIDAVGIGHIKSRPDQTRCEIRKMFGIPDSYDISDEGVQA